MTVTRFGAGHNSRMSAQDAELLVKRALTLPAAQTTEAVTLLRRAVEMAPGNADAWRTLGKVLGSCQEAVDCLERAVALAPKDSGALSDLAMLYLQMGRHAEAEPALRKAIVTNPRDEVLYMGLGFSLGKLSRQEEAIEALNKAVELNPKLVPATFSLGRLLQESGRFEEGEESFRKAVELNPLFGSAYSAIAHGRKMGEHDRPMVARMREVLATGKVAPSDAAAMHFALGKCLSDLGEYEQALTEYDRANEIMLDLVLRGKLYDRDRERRIYAHAAATFNGAFFQRYRSLGNESHKPIFILGMIRSGTTLTEQIVSSHPMVAAGGEISFWQQINVEVLGKTGRVPDEAGLKGVQERYLALLNEIGPGAERVTDKMPANYAWLGMIHLAFPNAKIIHLIRDPVDTALSIYMTPNSVPVNFGYVRENIVFAYKEYRRLMKLYRSILPAETMLDVRYEDLVADREVVTRRIIDFLGLPWDDACLHHEENQRVVSTPTLWQARQPIYNSAVRKWKNYEPWLGAFAALKE